MVGEGREVQVEECENLLGVIIFISSVCRHAKVSSYRQKNEKQKKNQTSHNYKPIEVVLNFAIRRFFHSTLNHC